MLLGLDDRSVGQSAHGSWKDQWDKWVGRSVLHLFKFVSVNLLVGPLILQIDIRDQ